MIYEIAELRVKINNRFKYTDRFCEKYLSNDQTSDSDLEIEVSDDEFNAEKEKSAEFSDGYVENLCIYRKMCSQMLKWDRFLMHTAVLEYKGDCYAFLGRSGTGKSTHTGLWLKNLSDAKILNGDKPILAYKNGEFIVYGTPWMGKERLGYNGKGKLKALCFLEQAKQNEITPIEKDKVAERLFVQLLMPEDFSQVARTLELADQMVKTVPAYLLKCDISYLAFKTAFDCLVGEQDGK
ncbi:MAG: hypothetical protein IJW64_02340 [Clostridia bacterium]|nr:hypothetical protein [Clostridia bacterium]